MHAITNIVIKIIGNFIAICLLFILFFAQIAIGQTTNQNVLVVNSYHFGYKWSDDMVSGIRDKIEKELPAANIFIEYMDSKHFDISYLDETFLNLLKQKHNNQKFDVVITTDDDASYFVFRHYEELYPNTPVVFCGVNEWRPEEVFTTQARKDNITGIVQTSGFAETYALARKFNPKINKVMLITDKQSTGQGYRKEALAAFAGNPDIKEVLDITGLTYTTAEMLKAVESADNQTAVIYAIWSMGRENIFYETQKMAQKLVQISPVPVYATSDVNIKGGLLGGMITKGYSTGAAATELAVEILKGKSVKEIPVVPHGVLEYAFNLNQLVKWKIERKLVPEPALIYNTEEQNVIFSEDEIKWINSQQAITVASFDNAPYIIEGDIPSGIAIDYMERLCKITGLKINYKRYHSYDDYVNQIGQDNCADISLLVNPQEADKDKLFITEPWLTVYHSLFVDKKQNLMLYTGLSSLTGQTVAVVSDEHTGVELLKKYPGIKTLTVPDHAAGFAAVAEGKAYGLLCDHSKGVYYANHLRMEQRVTAAPAYDISSHSIVVGVSKNSPELYAILVKAMAKISDAEVENIRQKYCMITTARPGIDFIDVMQAGFVLLLAFTVVATIGMLRLRRLKKALEVAYNQLQNYSDTLEQKVAYRTKELKEKNLALEKTLDELQKTQSQLILSEKMGALGHLIAGIAHEINSPLGAIYSAREVLHNNMHRIIKNNRQLAQWFIESDGALLEEMLNDAINSKQHIPLSTREKREKRLETIKQLKALEVKNAEEAGKMMMEINLADKVDKYLPVLQSKDGINKLQAITNITDMFLLCETIEIAVDKASRIIFAMNNYIRGNNREPNMMITKTMVDLRKSVDTVLTLYHNAIKNRAVLTVEYEDNLPTVLGNPDEINQIWSNIIQNAVQAISGENGTINVSVYQYQQGVVVTVKDNGCGMSQSVLNRVFEPMFTTKPVGEGTGLGMPIVHKIVYDNHHGKIEIHSKENVGTSISIWLPSVENAAVPENIISEPKLQHL